MVGYRPWVCQELDMTEHTHVPVISTDRPCPNRKACGFGGEPCLCASFTFVLAFDPQLLGRELMLMAGEMEAHR